VGLFNEKYQETWPKWAFPHRKALGLEEEEGVMISLNKGYIEISPVGAFT